MKHIKLLLFVSTLFFLIKFNPINAQNIENGTKYMFVGQFSGALKTDSINIIKQTLDTIIFERIAPEKLKGKQTFIKTNNLISIIEKSKIIPMYNYNLQIGDTFMLDAGDSIYKKVIPLYIDSIKNITLLDNKTYKHWYLHSNTLYNRQAVWIESIGESISGWDYRNIFDLEISFALYLVCKNNILTLNNVNLPPTCNFDSIKKVDVAPINNTMETIALYPNPAQNKIFVTNGFTGKDDWQITIYNSQGILMKSTTINNTNDFIDVSDLSKGFYLITVTSNKKIFKQKVTIE